MFYKIVTCLSIITVNAYGNEAKPTHAISSQRFHREDVPLSYQFHNVHNYKPRHQSEEESKEQRHHRNELRYHTIQYAPLEPGKIPAHKESHEENEQNLSPLLPQQNKETYAQEIKSNLEDRPKYDLEPKPLREDEAVHQKNYRSFVSGHNLEVFPQTTGQYMHVNSFPGPRFVQKEKKPGKILYYHKTTTDAFDTIPTHLTIEIQKPTMDYKLHQFVPSDQVKPVEVKPPVPNVLLTNINSPVHNNQNVNHYEHSLHHQLLKEKHQQTLHHPRIHLNIGRIYSIANQLQEAQLPTIRLPNTHQQPNYGKPLPILNLANSFPTNIVGNQQALTTALKKALPAKSGKQSLYTQYNPAPLTNLGIASNLSPAFYLQKHQENTLMLPIRNT